MISSLLRAPLGTVLLVCLVGLAVPVWASTDLDTAAAVQLVQAQLPKGISLFQADGETLGRAVSRAILGHRAQAPTILSAALTDGGDAKGTKNKDARQRSCDFVVRVVKAALFAAPEQASALTDTAAALYPNCADELTALLRSQDQRVSAYDYKDRADYKDRSDYKDRTDFKDAADYKDRAGAPVAGISDLGAGLGDPGFGVGFGPGFPGAPGFVGSAPTGGFALPPVALPTPGSAPVTAVVNE